MKNQILSQRNFFLSSKYFIVIGLFFFTPTNSLYAFPDLNLIHEIFVNGVATNATDGKIKLKTTDQVFIILSKIPDSLSYKYQCIGVDTGVVIGSSAYVNYTNFSEGTFEFKASTDTSRESPMHTQFTIEVSQPFLGSWDFILILFIYIFLIFGGATYFIIISNHRNRQKLYDLRSDWTNQLHNDIGADLSSVSLRINTLNRRLGKLDPELKGKVEKVHTILKTIQNKLRFVFNLVDPKKDSLQVMLSEIELFAKENCDLQEMTFTFENGLKAQEIHAINIGRINKIYLIMKEAVNNILKHSKAKNVSISTRNVKEGIFFSIKDDGQGFDSSIKHDGNGINNLMQYSREGFINVSINSLINEGTEVKIIVPNL